MIDLQLLLAAITGILLLLFLVIKLKIHAFISLLLASVVVGFISGMPYSDILDSVIEGMGGTLGFIALVVGLGAMFGKILEISGGAEILAKTMLTRFGDKKSPWALSITGFIVAIPVFFDVGFIIIIPLIYGLTKKTGKSILFYAIPLLAGLAVTHSFIPPTPGPVAVAKLLNADIGWVIVFGLCAGIPATILAGPVFGRIIASRIHAGIPAYFDENLAENSVRQLPSFGKVFLLILIPLVLILINTFSDIVFFQSKSLYDIAAFIGHPVIALLITVLLAIYILGIRGGFTMPQIQDFTTKALEPAGIVILVTGAGGVFKQVLINSGVGDMLGQIMSESAFPPLFLAFIISAVVRLIQGSATVAMITAAGILSPVLSTFSFNEMEVALFVIAISSGATIFSHVNDSGFWLVNRYLGLNEKQTILSWSLMETIIAFSGFIIVSLIFMLI